MSYVSNMKDPRTELGIPTRGSSGASLGCGTNSIVPCLPCPYFMLLLLPSDVVCHEYLFNEFVLVAVLRCVPAVPGLLNVRPTVITLLLVSVPWRVRLDNLSEDGLCGLSGRSGCSGACRSGSWAVGDGIVSWSPSIVDVVRPMRIISDEALSSRLSLCILSIPFTLSFRGGVGRYDCLGLLSDSRDDSSAEPQVSSFLNVG